MGKNEVCKSVDNDAVEKAIMECANEV